MTLRLNPVTKVDISGFYEFILTVGGVRHYQSWNVRTRTTADEMECQVFGTKMRRAGEIADENPWAFDYWQPDFVSCNE